MCKLHPPSGWDGGTGVKPQWTHVSMSINDVLFKRDLDYDYVYQLCINYWTMFTSINYLHSIGMQLSGVQTPWTLKTLIPFKPLRHFITLKPFKHRLDLFDPCNLCTSYTPSFSFQPLRHLDTLDPLKKTLLVS